MNIGLTFDLQTDPRDERQAEFDPPSTIEAVRRALETLGHAVVPLGGARDLLSAPGRLRAVDLVFNIAEGEYGRCREAWVPNLLEVLGVPYVGSDPLALALGLDKAMSKRLAASAGVLTPRWISVDHPDRLPRVLPLDFPLIVKPRFEGSGRGIDAQAVVGSRRALEARVRWLFERYPQPLLIEEFIAEGELTVFVIGNDPSTRPAERRDLLGITYPPVQRPLDPVTRLSCHLTSPVPSTGLAPLLLDEALEAGARRAALATFEALGCRDMARIDLRVDRTGRVFFLEINPLPSFDPDGTLGLLAECLGTTYTQLVGRILDAALLRMGSAACGVLR